MKNSAKSRNADKVDRKPKTKPKPMLTNVQHGEQKPNARSPEVRRGAVEYEMKHED